MPAIILYIATSQDLFIADKTGSVAFLDSINEWALEHKQDFGYPALLDRCDTIVMGRKTYEQVCSFGPWPYGNFTTYVLTESISDAENQSVIFVNSFEKLLKKIQSTAKKDIWLCGGAQIIALFDHAKMIDEIILTKISLLLSDGIPLIINWNHYVKVKEVVYHDQAVQITYKKV